MITDRRRSVIVALVLLTAGAAACGSPGAQVDVAGAAATYVPANPAEVAPSTIATTAPATTTPATTAPATTTPVTTPPVTRAPAAKAPVTSATATPKPAPKTAPKTAPQAAATQKAAGSSTQAAVVALTNDARADAGCAALTVDARLTTAAQRHSDDMAERSYFSHDSQDGTSFDERIDAAGYPRPGGENIARGQRSAAEVVQAWLDSPGHRANIENCSFTTIGVGFAADGDYWTQDFGR